MNHALGPRQPYGYIYLDRPGIESLFAQTTDRVEVEITRSHEAGSDVKGGAELGLGRALKALLGVEAKANVEISSAHKQLDEARMHMTVEHKLDAVISYLDGLEEGLLASTIRDAVQRIDASGGPVYVRVAEHWDAPAFYGGRMGIDQINRHGAIPFELSATASDPVDSYDHSDSYYKREEQPRVGMVASLVHFTRIRGQMTAVGHDTLLFRSHKGRRIPLTVFGLLTRAGGGFHQLKPYAIWL